MVGLRNLWILLFITKALSLDPIKTTVNIGKRAYHEIGKLICSTGLNECCDEYWVKNDVRSLEQDLKRKLHGQHLVIPSVVRAIKAHVSDGYPRKPLVMSFHGWTGGGKSYVSQMIVENLYKAAEKSKFVHMFYSELHFKNPSKVQEYKDQLHSWIYNSVSKCQRSVFVFDEMDHMPEGMIDVLIPFLGHHTHVDGVDFRKSIFIFISNVGGDLITQIAQKQRSEGLLREDLTLRDFQKPLEMSTYNLLSGLKGSDIIQRQLIDHFIPFLPLERKHVKKCVEFELRRQGVRNFSNDLLNEVLDELDWWPASEKIYSKSGCTKVTHKTRLVQGHQHDRESL